MVPDLVGRQLMSQEVYNQSQTCECWKNNGWHGPVHLAWTLHWCESIWCNDVSAQHKDAFDHPLLECHIIIIQVFPSRGSSVRHIYHVLRACSMPWQGGCQLVFCGSTIMLKHGWLWLVKILSKATLAGAPLPVCTISQHSSTQPHWARRYLQLCFSSHAHFISIIDSYPCRCAQLGNLIRRCLPFDCFFVAADRLNVKWMLSMSYICHEGKYTPVGVLKGIRN